MSTNNRRESASIRRSPSDEAYLRRYRADMKFAYAGPFANVLNPIKPVKPERGPSGVILRKQPRYIPTSAENWTVGAQVLQKGIRLGSGREVAFVPKRRRRGSRGRKAVAYVIYHRDAEFVEL